MADSHRHRYTGAFGKFSADSFARAPASPETQTTTKPNEDAAVQIASLYQAQNKIYPLAVTGWFVTWCWVLVWRTQLAFYVTPGLVWNGSQAVPQARALGYKQDTTKVDAKKYPNHAASQNCASCQLFLGKPKDATGGCPLFAGKQAAATAWCSAWAKKAA